MTKQKKLCPYWVWSKESNVHVAESLDWFTEYTPYRSKVQIVDGRSYVVVGVGTVYLSMRRTLEDDSPAAYDIFRIENVLYVPAAAGNVVGGPLEGLKVQFDISPAGRKSTALVNKNTGSVFCYFHAGWEDLGLLRVAVNVKMQCDSHKGCQWLKRICENQMTYTWPKAERAAWLNRKQAVSLVNGQVPVVIPSFVASTVYPPAEKLKKLVKGAANQTKPPAQAKQTKQEKKEPELKAVVENRTTKNSNKPVPNQTAPAKNGNGSGGQEPLNDAEEAWMNSNFGSEYDFLCGRGLFIKSDLDRQKGRQILRAMIDSAPGKSGKFCRSESDQSDQSGQPGNMHLSGDGESAEVMGIYGDHMSFFEEAWLQENFGSEQQFFEHYGLSINDRAQRRDGLCLMRDMMTAGYPEAVSASVKSEHTPRTVPDKSLNQLAVGGEKPAQSRSLIDLNSEEANVIAEEICLLDLLEEHETDGVPVSPAAPSPSYHQAAFSLLD